MLAKHKAVEVQCPACLGGSIASALCGGCFGLGSMHVMVEDETEDALWYEAITMLELVGVEQDEDAYTYRWRDGRWVVISLEQFRLLRCGDSAATQGNQPKERIMFTTEFSEELNELANTAAGVAEAQALLENARDVLRKQVTRLTDNGVTEAATHGSRVVESLSMAISVLSKLSG